MVFKQMLVIGAAAISFPALAQTVEPADGQARPAEQPAPADKAKPAPAETPTDDAKPADRQTDRSPPTDSAPNDGAPDDGDTPDEPAAEPNSGS